VREAAREQAAQWAAAHPSGVVAAALTGADAPAVLRAGARAAAVSPTAAAAQTGADAPAAGLTEIVAFTGGAALSPDRYHGHHGIQAIVRDVGPGGG
jgi:hypothetical protein